LSDESLFREVDEDVRQEQYKKLWSRYGNLIVAGCALVIIAVAGYKGWEFWQVRQAEAAAETFFSAAKLAGSGKVEDAAKQFESIGHDGFAMLARIREANALADQGKAAEAVKIYDAVAADAAVGPALRDLARVRAALALGDSASPADLEARLKGFDEASSPWRHTAREIMAAAFWRNKDYSATDKQVQAILADPETPQGIRQRATLLADLLVPLAGSK